MEQMKNAIVKHSLTLLTHVLLCYAMCALWNLKLFQSNSSEWKWLIFSHLKNMKAFLFLKDEKEKYHSQQKTEFAKNFLSQNFGEIRCKYPKLPLSQYYTVHCHWYIKWYPIHPSSTQHKKNFIKLFLISRHLQFFSSSNEAISGLIN